MRLKEHLRHIWHELYYGVASDRGVEFGMKCKDVVEKIDLGETSPNLVDRFRLRLHLSLCQACNNYFKITKALKHAVRGMVQKSEKPINVEQLNRKLLKKFARKKG